MRSAAGIVVDDVLRRAGSFTPIAEGLMLYRTLVPVYNVILLADQPELDEQLEHFFHTEQLTQHSMVYYATEKDHASAAVWLRNSGRALDFVVEPDPEQSAALFDRGVNVMHFMHAKYTRPQWRPDFRHEVTPWDELVQRETEARKLKGDDKRMVR